jgi:hypothetical protein
VGTFTSPFFELPHAASNVPTDKGYTKIYSNQYAFAALKADGSIKAWGDPDFGDVVIEPSALRAAKASAFE